MINYGHLLAKFTLILSIINHNAIHWKDNMEYTEVTSYLHNISNDYKPAILHICLSTGCGGLEMYPSRVGGQFLQKGYCVFGLASKNSRVAKFMKNAGMNVFTVKNKFQLFGPKLFELTRWLQKNKIKIIHSHKSGDILISMLLSLFTTRFSVFTEHIGVKHSKKDVYHRLVYRHINQVLSVSNETYQRNMNTLPVSKTNIQCLWLGTHIDARDISTPSINHKLKSELNLSKDTMLIGTVGRICKGKGQSELLTAFELIADEYPNAHLILIGGLLEDEGADVGFSLILQSQAVASAHTARIHFVGYRLDVSELLDEIQIVCLPYYNEAFGLTAIEAMSQRCAIVAANTGALPEILGDTGVYCDPQSSLSIAIGLKQYLSMPALIHKNATNGYLRVTKHFSMQGHVDKLESIYLNGVAQFV